MNTGKSGLPDVYILSLRPEGVYIRQTMSAHVTTIMYHLVIGYKPTYVTNNISKTLNPQAQLHHIYSYPLGYKYNFKMIYSRVKLPTKVFTKNESRVPQTIEFKNVDY